MEKKKRIILFAVGALLLIIALVIPAQAQDVDTVIFCDKAYNYGSDSLTLFFKARDNNGKMVDFIKNNQINRFRIAEEEFAIPDNKIRHVTTGKRIPPDVTFSVLVDLGISKEGKEQICKAIETLVQSVDSSNIFLSYFDDKVGNTVLITSDNFEMLCNNIINKESPGQRCFYSALYSKLTEFSPQCTPKGKYIPTDVSSDKYCEYFKREEVSEVANKTNPEKNILFLFTEGSYNRLPEPEFTLNVFKELQHQRGSYSGFIVPKVYAFVYTPDNNVDGNMVNVLNFFGKYSLSSDFDTVIKSFEEAVISEMYDYAFTYQVNKTYNGEEPANYTAYWDSTPVGTGSFYIGTKEKPWPIHHLTFVDCLIALLVALLTIIFYILVMKVLIPSIKSFVFWARYYKKYKAESGVQKLICCFCKDEIQPGRTVVTRCKHIMHKECWQANGYHCPEYGQNCKEGIQDHVDWRGLFSITALRDSYQTIAGVCAGLVSWIIYNLLGNKAFGSLSKGIVDTFYHVDKSQTNLTIECVTKVSSFLAIGLLLAFFLSLVFRYFDGIRKKGWKPLLRITGLSLLSGVIGMAAFALGGIILCLLTSRPLPPATTSQSLSAIPWYYSIPAYMLFSVCTSLSLTIKSSIPAKSALLGGLASGIIGFAVLYFSDITNSNRSWMNMLLDFVIYGGGLGASIVTVRMLAERYFLVIKNGIKSGHRIPIHKWMNATGGNNSVTIGMTQRCEIQMTWEKSNKVAKEHACLFVDRAKAQAMLKPMAPNVIYNSRAELPANKPVALSNNDTFTIGDTIFQYVES